MIKVHRLNGDPYVLNAELIETIESTPDSVITLLNGKKYMVKDSIEELLQEIIDYHRKCRSLHFSAAQAMDVSEEMS